MGELKKKRNQKKKQRTLLSSLIVGGILLIITLVFVKGIISDSHYSKNTEQSADFSTQQADNVNENEDTELLDQVVENTEAEDFTMFFTGDVMLQNCASVYASQGINGIISEYLEQEMLNADMTVINNEFPFSTRGEQAPDKQFTFRVDPGYVSALTDMGVDVASLANNHALDYGKEALSDTFTTLDSAGILYVGAGETKERAEEAVFVEAGGRTVGVLSASRVIPVGSWNIESSQPGLFCTYSSERMVQRIQEIEEQCDYVVVFVHWGIEREAYPEEYQRNLAKQYIDAGADLVVGNHSHVPQGIEYYNGVPIVYCLGNYIFNPNMVDTYALKVVWRVDGSTMLQVIPVDTENYYTSELDEAGTQAFYEYLESISFNVKILPDGTLMNVASEEFVYREE